MAYRSKKNCFANITKQASDGYRCIIAWKKNLDMWREEILATASGLEGYTLCENAWAKNQIITAEKSCMEEK